MSAQLGAAGVDLGEMEDGMVEEALAEDAAPDETAEVAEQPAAEVVES